MFKYFTLSLSLIISSGAFAQTKAITDSGEEVILNEDGTWKYANIQKAYATRLDTPVFEKDPKAIFLVKSKVAKFGIWINPKRWKFQQGTSESPNVEYLFTLPTETDVAVMSIIQRIDMPYPTFRDVFLNNLKNAGSNIQMMREETRKVNGLLTKLLEFKVTIKGVQFRYLGYYQTNKDGSSLLLAFTGENLFEKYQQEFETFLNGITVIHD